jgi:hypothetical protein
VKNFIRRGEFHQIASVMETGADHGMWTFARYRNWMAGKKDWHVPAKSGTGDTAEDIGRARAIVAPTAKPKSTERPEEQGATTPAGGTAAAKKNAGGRIEIDPDDFGFGKILKR